MQASNPSWLEVLFPFLGQMYLFSCYRADKRAKEKEESMGFSVPGRPKNWRDKAFKVLEESVSNRLGTFLMMFHDFINP